MGDTMAESFLDLLNNMLNLIAPGGALNQRLPGYCFRTEQQELITAITQCFHDDTYLLAEAGTGVGKSLAYLLPAAFYAMETGEKVVIATKTKALQDQLVQHDLPLLKEVLPFDFRFEEARGRENYLCPARLQKIIRGRTELEDEETRFVESIAGWSAATSSGDRKELHLDGSLMRHWHLVASNRHFCQSGKCGYEESCFRLKARRRWEEANLLVTNHALLLADAQMGRVLLPEYHTLIIDEAHQLPRQAQEHFSLRLGNLTILDFLTRLHIKIGGVERGLMPMLRMEYPQLENLIQQVIRCKDKAEYSARAFFNGVEEFLAKRWQAGTRIRLSSEDKERFWLDYADQWSQFLQRLDDLEQVIKVLAKEIPEEERGQFLSSVQEQLAELMAGTAVVEFDWGTRGKVVWAEREQGSNLSLVSAPLHPGNDLKDMLYTPVERLVMVSATMSVNKRFDYFINQCGLMEYEEEELLTTLNLSSPFDYENNCRVFIPSDMDLPGEPRYELQVTDTIARLVMAAPQRCLALFTSHNHMKTTAQMLRPILQAAGIPLLVQNEDGPFTRLVTRLQEENRGVLMGTETFWEGVDLPGDMMSLLMVVRLPFRSPSDPFYQAWLEEMPSGKVFTEIMLPEAVLKMKQGMGRLIRSERDRGHIVVLDRRMLPPPQGKSYANHFLSSLPMGKPQVVTLDDLPSLIAEWT